MQSMKTIHITVDTGNSTTIRMMDTPNGTNSQYNKESVVLQPRMEENAWTVVDATAVLLGLGARC